MPDLKLNLDLRDQREHPSAEDWAKVVRDLTYVRDIAHSLAMRVSLSTAIRFASRSGKVAVARERRALEKTLSEVKKTERTIACTTNAKACVSCQEKLDELDRIAALQVVIDEILGKAIPKGAQGPLFRSVTGAESRHPFWKSDSTDRTRGYIQRMPYFETGGVYYFRVSGTESE